MSWFTWTPAASLRTQLPSTGAGICHVGQKWKSGLWARGPQACLLRQVFLSARSNTWVYSRVSDHGFPFDMVSTTRFNHFLEWLLPSAITKRIKFRRFNSWFNHEIYGLASVKRCV